MLRNVGGYSLTPGGRVVSGTVEGISIGSCGHGSPDSSGTFHDLVLSPLPCENQSWTMNCSHEPARLLTEVAGVNFSRVSNLRETVRGLGSMIAGSGSGQVRSSGTLRPKRW